MNASFWGRDAKSVESWMDQCTKQSLLKRIWDRDPSVWKRDPAEQGEIVARLGWLDAVSKMKKESAGLKAFSEEIRSEGITEVVLLGMGGSSLAPEVFQKVCGNRAGFPKLTVLDSTDPARVKDVESSVDLSKTLFIVSSKSGGTVELVSFLKYFYQKLKTLFPENPGNRFIAITDPGSPLEESAKKQGFRKVFLGYPDVGGRFSALTPFGLLPAALIGVDIEKVLASAEKMMRRCAAEVPPHQNEAMALGVGMAVLAESGRDKLTLLSSAALAPFGDWAEQLVAESTGKEESGVVPVVGEPLETVEHYGEDRFFVALFPDFTEKKELNEKFSELKEAGHPGLAFNLPAPEDLGGEFFRWEMATAVASSLLKINAFDQPDVQAAKDRTKALLKRLEAGQELSVPESSGSLETFWETLKTGDYVAILAFLPDRSPVRSALSKLQADIRRSTKAAVTLGFGPRYLHSTGQLHKGGPDHGTFILLTADPESDLPIPGEKYSFGQLELAQALGDLEALRSKGRRVFHLRLKNISGSELEKAFDQVKSALMTSLGDEVS